MEILTAVVLAAGKGTRMKSETPKVLFPLAGKPMLQHIIDMLGTVGVQQIIVVAGHGSKKVQQSVIGDITWVEQHPQLGTGHALIQALPALGDFTGDVLIVCGDTPLMTGDTLTQLVNKHRNTQADATILTAILNDPAYYGRIVRDEQGNVASIVEHKDATPQQLAIKEINSGTFCFRWPAASRYLTALNQDNAQGEYYLTDIIEIMASKGRTVQTSAVADNREIIGINDRVQLARAEKIMRQRINEALMLGGVTIVDPDTAWIDSEVEVGRDSIILPNTCLKGRTSIGSFCRVGPGTTITDSVLGDGVVVRNSVVEGALVGNETTIGPFAYIRPACTIGSGVRIGDFVELKNSRVGDGSKIPHLSYVGDALVGDNVNIGCGVITANYDGKKKHVTEVDDDAFVGCNSNLVAPVKIGKGAYVAAGSTITRDVAPNSLAIARSRQTAKENWRRSD